MSNMEKWIGVDQGCTKMLMTAQYNGQWIDKKVPTGLGVTKEYLHEQINAFIQELPFQPEGMGLGVVGLVQDDELVLSDTEGLQGLKGSDFDLPCHILNDVKAATVEEASYYSDTDCMVLIMAGSGFALGVKEQAASCWVVMAGLVSWGLWCTRWTESCSLWIRFPADWAYWLA